MYFLYDSKVDANKNSFKRLKSVSLAGSETGVIVQYLRKTLDKSAKEPLKWHIVIENLLSTLGLPGNCLVIDAKPKSKDYVTLFDVRNIWGYSSCGWTPILLELKQILDDEDPNKYDRAHFILENYDNEQPVFTFLYLSGSVKNGEIKGKWLFPGPSPTNSVLLWPDALEYFTFQMGYAKRELFNPHRRSKC